MRIRNLGFGNGLADGAKGVEALGRRPGETLFLGFVLEVAGRQVDGEGVGFYYAFGVAVRVEVSNGFLLLGVGASDYEG